MKNGYKLFFSIFGIFLGVYLGFRFILPISFPFLLGAGLAWLAEPMTVFLCKKLPRSLSAAVSVTAAFFLVVLTTFLLGALLVRQLGRLPAIVPDLESTAAAGMNTLSAWLQGLTYRTPGNFGEYLRQNIAEFFSGGTALLDKVAGYLLNLAGSVLSHVPDSALSLGTALISSYMISAKLPKIRTFFRQLAQKPRLEQALKGLKGLRTALGGWLMAQVKLSGITWFIVTAGFLLLHISHAPLWATVVALVDAFPVLGTGTVLIPWSLVCLLQGESARGIGLLGIYAVVAITRSVLEPRLVGKQLGLDPLVTLFALYAGYKVWGLGGMLLAPMLAVAAVQLLPRKDKL